MPQFDTAAFFSQLFWLTVTFYGFYIIIFQTYLPGLTRILKVRRKKLELAQSQGSAFEEERLETVASFENIFAKSANESRALLGKTLDSGSAWASASLEETNSNALKQVNHDYLYLNGEIRGQRYVIQQLATKK
jgi:F0F1-type ATP synthase membrane subunit b/b'